MFSARGGFMSSSGTGGSPGDIVVLSSATPYFNAYAWTDASGFGTKYANPAGPSIAASGSFLAFNSTNTVMLASSSGTPYIQAYNYTVGSGFGSKFTTSATAFAAATTYIAWNPANYTEFAIVSNTTPFIEAMKWSSGFSTRYSNPATLPAGSAQVRFSTTGAAVGTSTNATNNYNMYPWNTTTGFGTRYSNPGTQSGQVARGLVFGPNNNFIQYLGSGGGILTTNWSDSTGFGSTVSNNGLTTLTFPAGNNVGFEITKYNAATSINWNIMINQTSGGGATGQIYATPYGITGTLTAGAQITTLPQTTGNNRVAIRSSSNLPVAVAVTNSTASPFMAAYQFNAGAIASTNPVGTIYSNPGTAISGASYAAAYTN